MESCSFRWHSALDLCAVGPIFLVIFFCFICVGVFKSWCCRATGFQWCHVLLCVFECSFFLQLVVLCLCLPWSPLQMPVDPSLQMVSPHGGVRPMVPVMPVVAWCSWRSHGAPGMWASLFPWRSVEPALPAPTKVSQACLVSTLVQNADPACKNHRMNLFMRYHYKGIDVNPSLVLATDVIGDNVKDKLLSWIWQLFLLLHV